MSYCVHCGVKLGEGEKRCPLCLTPVFDPAEPRRENAPRAYPVRMPEQELKKNKRFLLIMAALMLAAPALLCLMIDLLITGSITWSGYASSALILLFAAVTVPLLVVEKYQAYATVGAGFLCLNLYLFLVERLSGSGAWFFPIALPGISLCAMLMTIIILMYRREVLNRLTLIAASFAAVALECVVIEWLISAAQGKNGEFVWSPFVLTPCAFISLALFFINYNRAVREEVRRRVHF